MDGNLVEFGDLARSRPADRHLTHSAEIYSTKQIVRPISTSSVNQKLSECVFGVSPCDQAPTMHSVMSPKISDEGGVGRVLSCACLSTPSGVYNCQIIRRCQNDWFWETTMHVVRGVQGLCALEQLFGLPLTVSWTQDERSPAFTATSLHG